MHLYVYYEVPRDLPRAQIDRLREAIRSMQDGLAERCGHRGRLLRRVDESKPYDTWMEIYEEVDDAFEAQLTKAFEESGVRDLPAGPRHIERFAEFD